MYAKPMRRICVVRLPIFLARRTGNFERYGIEKNTITPVRLKSKCTSAKLIAASDWNIAARSAVIVVPILAPIINWKAFFTLTLPVATNGTINEVVSELDCATEVITKPQPKARYLFLNTAFSNRFFVRPMRIL